MRNPHSDINDLVTLDPELYRNLMFLRDYEGDFSDLALTFTTADNDVGQNREVSCVLTLLSDWSMTLLHISLVPFFPDPPPSPFPFPLLYLPFFLPISPRKSSWEETPSLLSLVLASQTHLASACAYAPSTNDLCVLIPFGMYNTG